MQVKLRNCKAMLSYEDCARLFMSPANLRRTGWEPDTRPLDNHRKTHLRVKRGPDGSYFDVVLYQTAMARYFRPVGNTHDVWYNTDPRQTSQQFNWNVLGHGEQWKLRTTEGIDVCVGMNKNASGVFPVRLHYVNGLLDVANSCDAPLLLRPTTSDERKAERKAFRAWLRPYIAMSKIIDGRYIYCVWSEVICAFTVDAGFDPTNLAMALKYKGVNFVVNACYPLGDVIQYHKSFEVVA